MMDRRILVSGSRDWPYQQVIDEALFRQLEVFDRFVLVHGDCPNGADRMADDWAAENYNRVTVEKHPADWNTGKAAGFQRNKLMVDLGADLLLAFRVNQSKGTTHTINLAKDAKIPSLVYDVYT